MKKTFISLALAICTSVPSLYAFHDQSTDHLVTGEPVMFIVTGPTFSPASYDAVRTAIGRYYSSDCFPFLFSLNSRKRNDDDGHQFTFVIRNQNVFCFRFSF